MMKRLVTFIACLLACGSLCAQQIDIGLGVTSNGRGSLGSGGTPAPLYKNGFDDQPLAHLTGAMDADTTKAMHSTTGTVNRGWRAAAALKLLSGTLVDFFVAQQDGTNPDDKRVASIYVRYSTDSGQTWSALKQIYVRESSGTPDYESSSKWINGPLGVVQHSSGRVHVIVCKSDGAPNSQLMTVWHMSFTGEPSTWSLVTTPTNISSTVVKASNASPAGQPACYGEADADWEWVMVTSGLCKAIEPNIGRIYFFGDHRYDTDEGGAYTSWAHCFYTDNGDSDTPTWVLGGGYNEVTAANDYSNETACVELSTGDILIQNRIQQGGNAYFRGQQTLTDPTTTWPQMALATTGAVTMEANPVHGSLWKNADGSKIYSAYAVDNAVRANIKVYESTDNGATWTVGRSVFYGLCGYCYGLTLANGNHRLLFEKTHNYGAELFGSSYSTQARFNDTWLENESAYPAVFEWGFTESQSGVGVSTVGSQFLDSGNGGSYIYDQRGLGGGNATYYSNAGEYGLTFGGSGTGVKLQEAQAYGVGGALQPGPDSITYEFTIYLPSSNAGTQRIMLDDCNLTAGGGVTVWLTTTGRLRGRVDDGTNSTSTAAGSVNLFDDAWHTLAVVVDRAADTIRCWETTTGTAVALSAAASISTVTGNIRGPQAVVLGRRATTDSEHLASGTILRRVRVTRKALSSGWMPHAGTVINRNDLLPVPTVPTIANWPSTPPKVWLGATYDLGYYARGDKTGGFDPIHNSTILGRGSAAYRSATSTGDLFTYGDSVSRGAYWDSDADVGPHWRHMYLSGASAGNYTSCGASGSVAANALFDVVQKTQRFSYFFCVKILTDSNGALFDNCANANTTGNEGWGLYRTATTGAITLRISDATGAGSPYFNAAPSNQTIASGTWTCFMLVGNTPGTGVKYTTYKATISGGVVSSITSANSTGDIPAVLASTASANHSSIFANTGSSSNGLNLRSKNVMLFDYPLTQAEFGALCAMCASY